jgi:putative aminopeptidase FrvX
MNEFNNSFLRILSELILVPAPPGREEMMASVICEKLAAWGIDSETDASGNVLVRLSGQNQANPKIILAAHMDEVAMIVTAIEDNGNLRVGPSVGLHPCKLGECQVVIMTDKEQAVSGLFPMWAPLANMGTGLARGRKTPVLFWRKRAGAHMFLAKKVRR